MHRACTGYRRCTSHSSACPTKVLFFENIAFLNLLHSAIALLFICDLYMMVWNCIELEDSPSSNFKIEKNTIYNTSNNIYKDQLCYMLVYVVIIFSYALFMACIETWEALSKHLNRKWAYTDDRIMGNFHNIVNFLGPSRYYYIHSIYAKLSV